MSVIEIIVLSVGLAMDAFAVAICKGLCMKKMQWKNAIVIGLYFGFFQAFMPLIGYLIGINFEMQIKVYDHWVVFGLLLFLGVKMIKASSESDNSNALIDIKTMILLSIATSIDALALRGVVCFFRCEYCFFECLYRSNYVCFICNWG